MYYEAIAYIIYFSSHAKASILKAIKVHVSSLASNIGTQDWTKQFNNAKVLLVLLN